MSRFPVLRTISAQIDSCQIGNLQQMLDECLLWSQKRLILHLGQYDHGRFASTRHVMWSLGERAVHHLTQPVFRFGQLPVHRTFHFEDS